MSEFQVIVAICLFLLTIMFEWFIMIGLSELKQIRKAIEKQNERSSEIHEHVEK